MFDLLRDFRRSDKENGTEKAKIPPKQKTLASKDKRRSSTEGVHNFGMRGTMTGLCFNENGREVSIFL